MGWWNTGCLVVHNYTNNAYTIVDQETIHSEPLIPGLRLVVGPRANNSFDGTIFPWCTDSTDVLVKAFRFYRGAEVIGDLEFFMFQDETVNAVGHHRGTTGRPRRPWQHPAWPR